MDSLLVALKQIVSTIVFTILETNKSKGFASFVS